MSDAPASAAPVTPWSVTEDEPATAGDLLIRAADAWDRHANHCDLDPCATCDVVVNQFRLALKVWQNSAHQQAGPQEPTRDWFIKRCAWYQSELDRLTARDRALVALVKDLRNGVGPDNGVGNSDYRRGLNVAYADAAEHLEEILGLGGDRGVSAPQREDT